MQLDFKNDERATARRTNNLIELRVKCLALAPNGLIEERGERRGSFIHSFILRSLGQS